MNVDKRRCPANHPCPAVRMCPTRAIVQNGYGLPQIDRAKCVDCGRCIRFCPMGAIGK